MHELKQRAELDVERATAAEAAAAADASKSAQLREQVAQAAADLGAKQASLERERGARGDVDAHTHELASELEETKVNLRRPIVYSREYTIGRRIWGLRG